MRVDLRIYAGDPNQFTNANEALSQVKSLLTAAIIKGLDMIGIVAPNTPTLGWQAQQLAKENQMDIWVVPGEEYLCADKILLFVYLLKESMPPNLPFEQAIAHAHQNSGFVMAANLSKRHSQQLASVAGTASAPDAIELYCEATGSYQDNKTDPSYTCFVSSGAKSANEIENSTAFTLVNRKDIEALGLLPENEGTEYIPPYLKRNQAIQKGNDLQSGAEEPALPISQNSV